MRKWHLRPFTVGKGFVLGESLFGGAKLPTNADSDKYKGSGYSIWFDTRRSFPLSDRSRCRNKAIIFGTDMSSWLLIDNKKRYIFILSKGRRNDLDDTSLAAEKEYAINFTELPKYFCLNFHYNGANSYICVNGVEI